MFDRFSTTTRTDGPSSRTQTQPTAHSHPVHTGASGRATARSLPAQHPHARVTCRRQKRGKGHRGGARRSVLDENCNLYVYLIVILRSTSHYLRSTTSRTDEVKIKQTSRFMT